LVIEERDQEVDERADGHIAGGEEELPEHRMEIDVGRHQPCPTMNIQRESSRKGVWTVLREAVRTYKRGV
jgi:hypothetical protein